MEGFNLGGYCYTTEAHTSHRGPIKVIDLQDACLHLLTVHHILQLGQYGVWGGQCLKIAPQKLASVPSRNSYFASM